MAFEDGKDKSGVDHCENEGECWLLPTGEPSWASGAEVSYVELRL